VGGGTVAGFNIRAEGAAPMTKLKIEDATEPFAFQVTEEIIAEAIRLGLNGRQMMALAIIRPSAPDAPIVRLGKLGFARINNGQIEIGGKWKR
jgi:hypothetical protein